ncbi:MAG: restriction endonuclease subunit S [Bacteroidaceae bacterium]|nr:restriction endonuclease subunit S [Bacteroidaceae bacterium]
MRKFIIFVGVTVVKQTTAYVQPKLTQKALNGIIINLPSTIDKQQSIVETLDSLKSKVDSLKQAILRQVFE